MEGLLPNERLHLCSRRSPPSLFRRDRSLGTFWTAPPDTISPPTAISTFLGVSW
jgi:hypothetical protein